MIFAKVMSLLVIITSPTWYFHHISNQSLANAVTIKRGEQLPKMKKKYFFNDSKDIGLWISFKHMWA